MKHFAVSAPVSAPRAHAFERNGEDHMTQKGFKRFQRRSTQDRLKDSEQDAASIPPQEAEPWSGASETGASDDTTMPEVDTATARYLSQNERINETGPVPPVPQPDVMPDRDIQPRVEAADQAPVSLPTRFDPWAQFPEVPFDFLGQKPSRLPLVSAFRASPTARAFDLLRTRLLHSLKTHGWKRVAVTSPSAGGGTTFCAVNLALSLARIPASRTVLMDLNFRAPGVAAALGIAPHGNMAEFLTGEVPIGQHLQRLSDTLAVGSNCAPDQNASEILHDPRTADVISALISDTGADTVLFDLPPVLEHDDVTAFLPQVDGVLLISDGDRTTAAELAACEKMLAGHAPLLGVVLNRAQQTDKTQVTP
jgi:Mrp family chromosome partitioning ATPase